MDTSDSTSPEHQQVSGMSRVLLAVIAGSLCIGGCLVCGGTLSVPFLIQRQRRAEEAVRRAQVEHNLKEIREGLRAKAEQDAVERQKAIPLRGDPSDSAERE
jgi:hypothetical protein